MVKKTFKTALLVLCLIEAVTWVGYRLATIKPEQKHPGVPLELKPPISRPRVVVKRIRVTALGETTHGCNRIPPGGGDCDALPYIHPDWSGYANGIVNRDIL